MRLKRNIPYFFIFLILLVYLTFFFLTAFSDSGYFYDSFLAATGRATVKLSSGAYRTSTTDLTAVIQPGETALLDGFDKLQYADFSGSTCYDEIEQWASAHPETVVAYTVTFPNNVQLSNTAYAADLSGLRRSDVPAAVSLLKYTPRISSINLGTSSQSSEPLTADDVTAIQNACPTASVSYAVDLLGKSMPLDTQSVDLAGITSAQLPSVLPALSLLTNVTNLHIPENATTDGSLTWEDLTSISAAAPSAAIDYNFSVCGVTATMSDTSLNLTSITPNDLSAVLAVLPGMSKLEYIDLGGDYNGLSFDDVARIGSACPKASISFTTSVYGKGINLSDSYIDLNHMAIPDNADSLRSILPYMKNLTGLDMDSCGVPDEIMAQIRDENPGVNVVWRVNFGNYSVRTDVVKILASKPSKGGILTNASAQCLKYCTKVRYLDLGHNDELSDFSFVASMPDLEIVVISMCAISDLTPFSYCKNLIYMEAGNTKISDLTPLASCPNLKHLNVGTCLNVKDISPLYDVDLLRLWLGRGDPVPAEQVAKMSELHPDCDIDTTCPTGLERDANGNVMNEGYVQNGWKMFHQYMLEDWNFYDRYGYFPAQKPKGYYEIIYNAFQYNLDQQAYAFSYNDPMYNPHGDVDPVNMNVIDTSFLLTKYIEEPDL